MPLADFTPPTLAVPLGKKGSFTVKGLSLEDIQQLASVYYPDMVGLFEAYDQALQNAAIGGGLTTQFILELCRRAPGLVAEVIALASGEPGMFDKARSLPFPVQIDALQKITTLTFEDAGGPKNFFATLRELAGSLLPAELVEAAERSRSPQVGSTSTSPTSGET